MTSRRSASSPRYASAGGHELQPSEVNSSTTAGRGCALTARLQANIAQTRSTPAIQCRCGDAHIEDPPHVMASLNRPGVFSEYYTGRLRQVGGGAVSLQHAARA